MGLEKEFDKVKLFTGFIYKEAAVYREIKLRLVEAFSAVDLESREFSFDKTTYYDAEMGSPLFKRFISFSELIDPVALVDIKLFTNRIEEETAHTSGRVVNVDPGFLSHANVILATTKNHYHRIPLQKGIYAHLEYVVKKNRVTTMEWTYPDFRTEEYRDFFNRLIPIYKENVKNL